MGLTHQTTDLDVSTLVRSFAFAPGWIVLACRTTLILEMHRVRSWLDCVLGCSTTLVLEMPRLGSWLDCAGFWYNFSTGNASCWVLAGLRWVVVIVQL